jgi:hypothetical protein
MQTLSKIQDWLNQPVPDEEISWTEDAQPAAYQPIWVIEFLLNQLSENTWERYDHKYSFHTDREGFEWLATSHLLKVQLGKTEVSRVLVCSSFIRLIDYGGNSNILQTGIAEATKAGCKVLGCRFGNTLNNRAEIKVKSVKERVKPKPDAKILMQYNQAKEFKQTDIINKIEEIYDVK